MPSFNLKPRLLKSVAIIAATVLVACLYVYAYDKIRIVRLDEMFSPRFGWEAGLRERYFMQKFPTAREITKYLSDATILISSPPFGNEVFYFRSDHKFVYWYNDQLSSGEWWISPRLELIILGSRWRFAVVYTYCRLFLDLPSTAQQDSCREVQTLGSIIGTGRAARREYRKGNVLNFGESGKGHIESLPKSEISIEMLRQVKRNHDN